jgi:hypothetical protein
MICWFVRCDPELLLRPQLRIHSFEPRPASMPPPGGASKSCSQLSTKNALSQSPCSPSDDGNREAEDLIWTDSFEDEREF